MYITPRSGPWKNKECKMIAMYLFKEVVIIHGKSKASKEGYYIFLLNAS